MIQRKSLSSKIATANINVFRRYCDKFSQEMQEFLWLIVFLCHYIQGPPPHQRLRHFLCLFDMSLINVEKRREMSSFENFKKFPRHVKKCRVLRISECLKLLNSCICHLSSARKMIFNDNYEEKLTESSENKRNWVQLGSIGRLRHYLSVCDVSRNVERCREMSSFVEVAVGGTFIKSRSSILMDDFGLNQCNMHRHDS